MSNASLLVYITAPSLETAKSLAKELVENRLAAGANVNGPVTSIYRWQGTVKEASEWQIFIQTRAENFNDLCALALKLHPHIVPCIIATKIAMGHEPFLRWITANTSGGDVCNLR